VSKHLLHHPFNTSKYWSNLATLWPPSSHDHCHQVNLQDCWILASMIARSGPPTVFPKLALLQPWSVCPNSLNYGLHSGSIAASKCNTTLIQVRPPSAYLQTRPITASKCIVKLASITASKSIFKLARIRPPSSHDRGLQVLLQTRSITAAEYISELTRSSSPGGSRFALKYHLQP